MSTERYHKAAKDNHLEILKEATKRDCNARNKERMTPTMYAAYYGNLEALRVLCARGGDPDKASLFGNTALHLAAAQGHKKVVTFLVNFGANIYAKDIDGHTPQDIAGINNRDEILRFLDGVHAKLEGSDKKKMKALQDKAAEDQKKWIKDYNKYREKEDKRKTKDHRPSMMQTLRIKMKSGSTTNLSAQPAPAPRATFSNLVSGGTVSGKKRMGTVEKMVWASKNTRLGGQGGEDFKISEVEDGKRSVRSVKGIRRDSEVLFSGTIDNRRGRLNDIFNNEAEYISKDPPPPSSGMIRSLSQPDFLQDLRDGRDKPREPSSIFVRPGMGSIVIRKSINSTFGGLYSGIGSIDESSLDSGESYTRPNMPDYDLSDSESSEDDNPNGPLERFLTAFNLGDCLQQFVDQKIDLDTLMMLTETDMKSLNLPLGHYRKLVNAVNERKAALENPGEVTDSPL